MQIERLTDSKYIIGKIPGYNTNLTDNDVVKNYYRDRLLTGISSIDIKPMGYNFNTNLVGFSKEGDTSTKPIFELSGNTKGTIWRKGPSGDLLDIAKDEVTAREIWQKMMTAHDLAEEGALDIITILATNESTVNESINNTFGENAMESLLGNGLGKMLGTFSKTIQGAKDLAGGFSSMTPLNALGSFNNATNSDKLMAAVTGKALGIAMSMPQAWKSSSYNSNLQLMVKLTSPSGHKDDIYNYIMKPLKTLILTGSPITYDGILYGYPMLWNVKAHGLLEMRLAGVESIILTRGGNDTTFSKNEQPVNIDVRIIFKPIIAGFASAADSASATGLKSTTTGEPSTALMTTLFDIENSMEIKL